MSFSIITLVHRLDHNLGTQFFSGSANFFSVFLVFVRGGGMVVALEGVGGNEREGKGGRVVRIF